MYDGCFTRGVLGLFGDYVGPYIKENVLDWYRFYVYEGIIYLKLGFLQFTYNVW
jgi:hypothetical protein